MQASQTPNQVHLLAEAFAGGLRGYVFGGPDTAVSARPESVKVPLTGALNETLRSAERAYLQAAIERNDGNLQAVALEARLTMDALAELLERHALEPPTRRQTTLDDLLKVIPYRDIKAILNHTFDRWYLQQLKKLAPCTVTEAALLAQVDRAYLTKLCKRHGVRLVEPG